jgi:hypothetical protein
MADTSKLADGCMIAALITAVFGLIYEVFSFGVFSYAMIYAFGFFAVGGVLFWRVKGIKRKTVPAMAACFWNAGLATLTIGSVLKGVLDIYGSSNSLLFIFPILGIVDILVSLMLFRIRGSKGQAPVAAR